MHTLAQIQHDLASYATAENAKNLQWFFKTGSGQYGEGDIFIGVKMPQLRLVAKRYQHLPLQQIIELLHSPVHEHRMTALVIMTLQAKHSDDTHRQALYQAYLANSDYINNWDLVDVSCRDIVGIYLRDKSRQPLYTLAASTDIWQRRIAIVSTWQFIRDNDLHDTFAIATLLLGDKQDLIHKAVGWMLREAGKRSESQLCNFLDMHAATMPRTALRYAIERLTPIQRQQYMTAKG